MKVSRKFIIAAGAVVLVLVAAVGLVAIRVGNDFYCSGAEQKAMSEFPHFNGAEAEWESNFKITGGCSTSYMAEAEPPEVLSYYQEHLRKLGWTVSKAPANSFPSHFQAERGELRFSLQFEGSQMAQLATWPPAERTAQVEALRAQEADENFVGVREGKTRVSISGGHKQ